MAKRMTVVPASPMEETGRPETAVETRQRLQHEWDEAQWRGSTPDTLPVDSKAEPATVHEMKRDRKRHVYKYED